MSTRLNVYITRLLSDNSKKRTEDTAMLAEDALRAYLIEIEAESKELESLERSELAEIVQLASAASTARSLAKLAFQPDATLVELDPPISEQLSG